MRQLHHEELAPVRVGFVHPMPETGDAPYRRMFRSPVAFAQTECVLVFAKAGLDQPLKGSCPELARFHDNLATEYLARLDKNDIVSSVRAKISELLPTGEFDRGNVARAIGMSSSTLQLKLAQRGTTFVDLLDDVRRELACSYLQQSAMSVTEVSFIVGFTDTSNFTRAFKRWTGSVPTAYRARR
jgi:AraC-like DNA-binding protein